MADSSKETIFVEDGVQACPPAQFYTHMDPASHRYGNNLAGRRNNIKEIPFLMHCRKRGKGA
jgi:hypothetical protein